MTTIKIDIDKYTSNSPFIRKMLHMADEGNFGEKENGNGMLDTEKETDRFLKLAEKNKDKLAKKGFKIEGNSGIFTITRTNPNYDPEKYNSVLTYDLKHDYISQVITGKSISTKTVFDNNDETTTTVYDSVDKHVFERLHNDAPISNIFLVLHNTLTFGSVSRQLKIMNELSNI